jgi:hypothetical protein
MEDKRKFPRFELPLPLIYYPEKEPLQFSYSISKNVSRGGLCIPAISSIIKNGDIIKMEIGIDKEHCISATGKVRWSNTLNSDAPANKEVAREFIADEEVGVEFIDAVSTDIDRLLNVKRSLRKPTIFDL